MLDNALYEYDSDDDGYIFANGRMLDLEALDSAIDALARDESTQVAEGRTNNDCLAS